MSTVDLLCADQVIRVDASLCEMSTERVHWRRFIAPPGATPALVVRRHAALDGATAIDAPLGRCGFRFDGATLDVTVEDGMYRGELVLRLAWYLLGTKLGAVLIHASAVRGGQRALVAAGKSGDGKSTLARLCRGAGLELLTDEVVMLLPGGLVSGTPFRSDADNAGQPGVVRARYFVALEKAQHEALSPLSPLAAVQLALGQCFDVAEVALPRAEVRRRLLDFLASVEVRTLAFRKDPAAGVFVRGALEE
ncbi:MAG: hypothetical protein ACOZQL_33970 [Myxococcota bacterium]